MKKRHVLIVTAMFALLSLAGCDFLSDLFGLSSAGSLILQIENSKINSRTIVPDIVMETVSYSISASGPDEQSFTEELTDGDLLLVDDLAVGEWTVTVEGVNPDAIVIASDTELFTIADDETTIVDIVLLPLPGTGTLNITMIWPEDIVASPDVSGSLTPDDGATDPIELPVDGESASFSNSELNCGYYTLAVQLFDGAKVVWGMVEVIRIINEAATNVEIEIIAEEMNPLGGSVQIGIDEDLQNPFDITLTGYQTTLPAGTDMEVLANPTVAPDSYQWYLSGAALSGADAQNITIGSALEIGGHRLDVVVEKGDVLSSAHVVFAVFDPAGIPIGNIANAYLNVPEGQISNTSISMQFSTDDGVNWSDCTGSYTPLTPATGNRVWVRQSTGGPPHFLGEVTALAGPDLVAGPCYPGIYDDGYWYDENAGPAGATWYFILYSGNIGDSSTTTDSDNNYYFSADRVLDGGDTLLTLSPNPGTFFSTGVGDEFQGIWDFIIPSVPAGTYYIVYEADVSNAVVEINEDNNASRPEQAMEFIVVESETPAAGAFKMVNSWGDYGSTWENVYDGHYWITYDVVKALEMGISYFYNDTSETYTPTIVAAFQIDHPKRNECRLTLGLGDPADPVISKVVQSQYSSGTIITGAEPFPANPIVIDISEFAFYINDYDLYLVLENLGSTAATVLSFNVEYYSDYDAAALVTVAGTDGTVAGTLSETFVAATTGALTEAQLPLIIPPPRATIASSQFIEEYPEPEELELDKQRIGVAVEGVNYNEIVHGFGTGLKPPTEEEWATMKKLRGVQTFRTMGALPLSIDHSVSPFFPPVGSQAGEGSCTAWAVGYYVHTFNMAKEHNWDLLTTTWSGGWDGFPAINQDKIISPDFIYHQINNGVDQGSNMSMASSFLTRIGASSWQTMPYDYQDSTSWPSEEAWRESARYRGHGLQEGYFGADDRSGYFVVDDDASVQLLKTLLASGYCVATGIHTDIYDYFDANDVISDSGISVTGINHAQTIVGYKEGADWNQADPDA